MYFNVRLDRDRQCILVIIGVIEYGQKEFVAIEDGYQEFEQSWQEILLRIKSRCLTLGPSLAIGDGSLAAHSNDQPCRIDVCDRAIKNRQNAGMRFQKNHFGYGLQAWSECGKEMAKIAGIQVAGRGYSRCYVC